MLHSFRRLLVALLGFVLLSTTACKKDKDPHTPVPPAKQKKLVKIQESPDDYTSFDYNTDGTLQKMTVSNRFESGLIVYSLTLQYGADKKIDQAVYNNGNKLKFFYENGLLTKTELADDKGVLLNVYTFIYDYKKRLTTYTVFGPFPLDDGAPGTSYKPVLKTEYAYFNVNDSLVHEAVTYKRNPVTKQMDKWLIVRADSYDDKKNPLAELGDLSLALFQEVSKRNVTSGGIYDADYILKEYTENDYTYRGDGYPSANVQKSLDPRGTIPTILNITYTYQ
jgi:hypothetical protein